MSRCSRDVPLDGAVQQILDVLAAYEICHGNAKIEAYRQNSSSIRIRIVNPEFKGLDRVQREERVWAMLERLPEHTQRQITLLLAVDT